MDRSIELVYFDGCPNIQDARANLWLALTELGYSTEWQEWNLDDSDTPGRVRGYASPAVLVGGRHVRGEIPTQDDSRACSALGAPDVQVITKALEGEAA